ncbi:ubiquitin domain-containing protein 7SL RNA2-like [Corylus avellana]|uniref:ubiquitin domain-containing protein 7SL RNA2-like n=1 Tax=Corylus avellana TaxID=13451 RepID=UPI001E239C2B|nr:ubiquitin domain-containing protein 7SL RNA2-like [Corylus avellana]
MDVIFELQQGGSFSIEVGFFDTVLEIKEKIQKYQAIPISNQTLIFNGNVLQDNHYVGQCQIHQNSHIQLNIVSPEPNKAIVSPEPNKAIVEIDNLSMSKTIQVNIKTPKSKFYVPVKMDVNDTIGELKEKIKELKDEAIIDEIVLHSNGIELQDHKPLRDYEFSNNSEVDVSFRGSQKLDIMVLTRCGTKTIPVEVNDLDNVGELRKELERLQKMIPFPLPQEGYFFIYEQDVMNENRSFRWHNVGQGDTIEIFNGTVTSMEPDHP